MYFKVQTFRSNSLHCCWSHGFIGFTVTESCATATLASLRPLRGRPGIWLSCVVEPLFSNFLIDQQTVDSLGATWCPKIVRNFRTVTAWFPPFWSWVFTLETRNSLLYLFTPILHKQSLRTTKPLVDTNLNDNRSEKIAKQKRWPLQIRRCFWDALYIFSNLSECLRKSRKKRSQI